MKQSTSPSRVRTVNPIVREVVSAAYQNMRIFECGKKEYFKRFILPQLGRYVLYRQFDAVTAARYVENFELPTRGKHRDRSGIVETIPYELFLAIRESSGPARETLRTELVRRKENQKQENKKKAQDNEH